MVFRRVPKRFENPREFGCFTAYRRVDVLRIVEVARVLSATPKVIDVGCGNGDLLEKVREYIPDAIGIDVDEKFAVKPYIKCIDVNDVKEKFDLAILSWMELRKDYREAVSRIADAIVSVWERGGATGDSTREESCTQDFGEFSFISLATWRTPAWFDVDMRLRFQDFGHPILSIDLGCIWEVWGRKGLHERIGVALEDYARREKEMKIKPYPFEGYYDKAGYPLWGSFHMMYTNAEPVMWEILSRKVSAEKV